MKQPKIKSSFERLVFMSDGPTAISGRLIVAVADPSVLVGQSVPESLLTRADIRLIQCLVKS